MSNNEIILKSISRDKWELQKAVFISGFRIPQGFQTDLASIPRLLWPIVGHKTDMKFQAAAIFHDYVLRYNRLSRKDADRGFRVILKNSGVSPFKSWCMWAAVRWFYWV